MVRSALGRLVQGRQLKEGVVGREQGMELLLTRNLLKRTKKKMSLVPIESLSY